MELFKNKKKKIVKTIDEPVENAQTIIDEG